MVERAAELAADGSGLLSPAGLSFCCQPLLVPAQQHARPPTDAPISGAAGPPVGDSRPIGSSDGRGSTNDASLTGGEPISGTEPVSRERQKRMRNSGRPYLARSHKFNPGKQFAPVDCHCQLRCAEKVSVARQLEIFQQFWDLADWQLQGQFICNFVYPMPTKRQTKGAEASRRAFSRCYYLPLGLQKVSVCKRFFLGVMKINSGRVEYAMKRKLSSPLGVMLPDQRGRRAPANKTPAQQVLHLQRHLATAPADGADGGATADCCARLYRQYCDRCVSEGRRPVGASVFRRYWRQARARRPARSGPPG
ncbi:uncharacterized protein LOC119104265 [Pollicipes pollicipes]|uniref:uncharacterized protein LOC119104265 n=1 Tax=Pollicipes pollicipes TaxID=41117 RepID=UPI001884C9EB|nr:uncharacterized protein LOC119104265 [Pollicipes pollicipes]